MPEYTAEQLSILAKMRAKLLPSRAKASPALAAKIEAQAERIAELERDNARLRVEASAALAIATTAPELNPSNYDHDDACRLNSAMIQIHAILDAAFKDAVR